MDIKKIIEMVEDIKQVALTEKERKKLKEDFIKNFNNEFEIIEK